MEFLISTLLELPCVFTTRPLHNGLTQRYGRKDIYGRIHLRNGAHGNILRNLIGKLYGISGFPVTAELNRQPGDGVARITEPHHPVAIPAESCM